MNWLMSPICLSLPGADLTCPSDRQIVNNRPHTHTHRHTDTHTRTCCMAAVTEVVVKHPNAFLGQGALQLKQDTGPSESAECHGVANNRRHTWPIIWVKGSQKAKLSPRPSPQNTHTHTLTALRSASYLIQ